VPERNNYFLEAQKRENSRIWLSSCFASVSGCGYEETPARGKNAQWCARIKAATVCLATRDALMEKLLLRTFLVIATKIFVCLLQKAALAYKWRIDHIGLDRLCAFMGERQTSFESNISTDF